jgi:hypothetical protein
MLVTALASATFASAEVASKWKTIVVVQPKDLPQIAQATGQSMELLTAGNGRRYLYIEQQQLGRIAILDVTDLSRIKAVGTQKLDVPAAFDFGPRIGESAFLVYFRDGSGAAVLDLRKPKDPALGQTSSMLEGTDLQKIGQFGLLVADAPRPSAMRPAQDYRIVDSSNPTDPKLLDTVEKVQQEIANDQMGTTFLLGAEGLTVVRRPVVERDHRFDETYTN